MKGFLTNIAILFCVILLGMFLAKTVSVMDNVYIEDFALSEDGQTMTIRVAVGVSVGYTRSVTIRDNGYCLELYFHPAYGGINGKIGAKNTFEIPLKPDHHQIFICNSGHGLYRNNLGKWQFQNFTTVPTTAH